MEEGPQEDLFGGRGGVQAEGLSRACAIPEVVPCRGQMLGEKARGRDPDDWASAKLWVQRAERSRTALGRRLAGRRSHVGLGEMIL